MSDVANPAFTVQNMGAKPEVVVSDKPKPTIPGDPNKIVEQIKARIATANAPAPKPTEPAKTEPTGTEPAKEIVPDAKATLAELAKAQAKVRELTEKAKLAESLSAEAATAKELKELAAKDKLAAITKLFGSDNAEDVLAELVTMFYEREPGQAPTGQPKAPASPELKQLMDKLEMVTKELADIKTGAASKTETEQKQAQAAQESATKAYLRSVAEKHKDLFEISSRAENLDEAIGKAMAKVSDQEWSKKAMERLKIENPAQLSAEQADALAREAIRATEDEYEELGKRFGKGRAEQRPSVYDIPFTTRAPKLEFTRKPAKETFAEYKARIQAEYEAARGG